MSQQLSDRALCITVTIGVINSAAQLIEKKWGHLSLIPAGYLVLKLSPSTYLLLCCTVAVWTQKTFFPLLIHPQGSQGCQKITFFFLQMKLFSFCAKIAPKRHKLQKPSKLKKKCQKNPVFLDFFKYSSIWGQY